MRLRTVQSAYLLALVGTAIALPLDLAAQQWSSEQQEVWDAEVACLDAGIDDVAARKACVHPDFMGWGVQGPVPTAYSEADFDHYMNHNALKVVKATPLNILVEGDLAVVQLMVMTVSSLDDGPDETAWVAWTDIMKKDDGKWRWISDHGHVPGSSE